MLIISYNEFKMQKDLLCILSYYFSILIVAVMVERDTVYSKLFSQRFPSLSSIYPDDIFASLNSYWIFRYVHLYILLHSLYRNIILE